MRDSLPNNVICTREPLRVAVPSRLLILCLVVAIAATLGCGHRSDARLRHQFETARADCDQLRSMFAEDQHLVRIAPDYTMARDNAQWPSPDVGLSEQRWNEYRRLFESTGAELGILRRDSGLVLMMVSAVGWMDSGTYKGYAYLEDPPEQIVSSLDGREDDSWAFVHLTGNWYIGQGG